MKITQPKKTICKMSSVAQEDVFQVWPNTPDVSAMLDVAFKCNI